LRASCVSQYVPSPLPQQTQQKSPSILLGKKKYFTEPSLFEKQVFSTLSAVPSASVYLGDNEILSKISEIRADPSSFDEYVVRFSCTISMPTPKNHFRHMKDERMLHIANVLAGYCYLHVGRLSPN